MRKTRILLASILKPVNDTRMFEKFGQSLAKLPGMEIHLVGQATSQKQEQGRNIFFYPLSTFKRLSFDRISAHWKIYKTILKLKPEVIIITTAELLPLMAICKILFKAEIYYHIGDREDLDRKYALAAGFEFLWPEEAIVQPWFI